MSTHHFDSSKIKCLVVRVRTYGRQYQCYPILTKGNNSLSLLLFFNFHFLIKSLKICQIIRAKLQSMTLGEKMIDKIASKKTKEGSYLHIEGALLDKKL